MPPTLMVASAARDKYGQSEAITVRAEEPSEIIKKMEKKEMKRSHPWQSLCKSEKSAFS